ncbi:MAG: GAF domain-containing protein [Cyanobacteria bacterium NC_groundwater_1444_Ag_S-0.65um_54_12]|nr:GAF domain-containing protein [Cyanobacteria bacterium NC_groundwater_1444_Ag_S-0.65um_54_12]
MTESGSALSAQAAVARLLLLREVSQAFNSSLDLVRVFQLVLERVTSVLAAEAASIWLVQEPSNELLCETAIGPVKDRVQGIRLDWGTGIVGWVIQHAKPVIVADAQNDRFLSRQVDSESGFVTRSMICAPMMSHGKCLGAIQIVNKVPASDLFVPDDLDLLADMAIDAGIAVENARLYQAESKVRELQALLKISREITATLDLDRLLKTVVNILSSVVTYDRCAIALQEGDILTLNAVSGQAKIDLKDPVTKVLDAFLRQLVGRQEPGYLVLPDGSEVVCDYFKERQSSAMPTIANFMSETGSKSVLLLPLKDEEGPVGLLCLESKTPANFSSSQIEIISILAAQITVAIRNAQLYRQVPAISIKGLKGLLQPKLITRRGLLAIIAAMLTIPLLVGIHVPLQVSGHAQVLPADQIGVIAREGGIIKQIYVNEGSTVQQGQTVARLEEQDLKLALQSITTDLAIGRVRVQQLRLASDVGSIAVEELKIRQLAANAALLQSKIEHANLLAPISGVIMTPSLPERLGETLSKGEELLRMATTAEMRVEVEIPETEISLVKPGQAVSVRLLAHPLRTFRGLVQTISPEAKATSAGPTFKVTARISNNDALLRSGMQGMARVDTGKRRLIILLLRAPAGWLSAIWWRLRP